MKINLLSAKQRPNTSFDFMFRFVPRKDVVLNTPHKILGEAEISGTYKYDEQENCVEVVASLRAPMEYVCDRCGETYRKNLFCQETQMFFETKSDENEFTFDGYYLDLTDFAECMIMSNIDCVSLCKPDCKGVCLGCGANLNNTKCTCKDNK